MQESVKFNRNHYIGGSDIPVIMGISKFKSRFELLRQKANLETDTFTGNKYTEYGNTLEPKIREFLSQKYKEQYNEGRYYKDPFEYDSEFDYPIRCHLDGETDKSVLEIKTTTEDVAGLIDNIDDDTVLRSTFKSYLVQTLFYMMIANKKVGCIAVYLRPDDFDPNFKADRLRCFWFNLKEYDDIIADIKFEVRKFISDLKRLKDNPFLSEEDFVPMDIKVIAQNLIYLENEIAKYKKTLNDFEMLKSKMFQSMQDHQVESFRTESGFLISAIAEVKPTEEIVEHFDLERFKAEHPKLAKKYTTESVELRKGRKGYLRITPPKEGVANG